MNRRDLLLTALSAGASLAMTDATAQTSPIRYSAMALQTRCDAVNQDSTKEAARARSFNKARLHVMRAA